MLADPSQKNQPVMPPLFKEPAADDISGLHDTRKLYLGIQRHLLAIALTIIVAVGIGVYGTWYFKTHYRAESVIVFQKEDLPQQLPVNISLTSLTMQAALDLVVLPSHIEAVKAVLGLDLRTRELESMVSVPNPRFNSNLIRIVTTSSNPHLAIDISNTLAKIAVKGSQDFLQQQLQMELDNYRGQLEQANSKIASQNKEIEGFKKQHRYFEMTADYAVLVQQMVQSKKELQEATLKYNSLLVEYDNLKHQIETMPDKVEGTAYADGGGPHSRATELQHLLAEARAKYAPTNPKLIQLEKEYAELTGTTEGESEGESKSLYERNPVKSKIELDLIRLQSRLRAAEKMKDDLAQLVSGMEKEMETLPSEQVSFAHLLENKKITEEQVQYLSKAVETIKLLLNVPKGGLEIYHLADEAKPIKEGWWVDLLPFAGLLFGLGLSIGVALFLESRDTRLVTMRQVKLYYELAPLLTIPDLGRLDKDVGTKKTLFFIRGLAERLERQGLKKHDAVAFFSARHGEGKSTLAYFLALYYASLGQKVLLLQLDWHANTYSEDVSKPGIESYLQGESNWLDLVEKDAVDVIHVAGRHAGMKELVKSPKMAAFIKEARDTYDHILIDTPGVIEEVYAPNLASYADLCVFLVDSSKTPKKIVDESLHELDATGSRPCGIVLNKVPLVYIEDQKIKNEIKRVSGGFWSKLFPG